MHPDAEDGSPVYDITHSQAFGPNRRYVREEIDLALNELRVAYHGSQSKYVRAAIIKAANRLKELRIRFANV